MKCGRFGGVRGRDALDRTGLGRYEVVLEACINHESIDLKEDSCRTSAGFIGKPISS